MHSSAFIFILAGFLLATSWPALAPFSVPGEPRAEPRPGDGLAAAPLLRPYLLRPFPPGFFQLAYCGSGRRSDAESGLNRHDWDAAALAHDLTIVHGIDQEYSRLIQHLVRRKPDHRVLVYVHSHGIQAYDDRAGVLNLFESNFVHATDPASLRVIPTAEGLLLDWEGDERPHYDEHDRISPSRDFTVTGYIVYRAEGDGELSRLAPEVADPSASPSAIKETEFLDRAVEPGLRYRYAIRTLGPQDFEYAFSDTIEEFASMPGSPLKPLIHGLEDLVQAAPDRKPYLARFRIRSAEPVTRAVLHFDRNADGDFAGAGEAVLMQPAGTEGWLEASTQLEPSDHTDLDDKVVFGFAYRLEIETPSGLVVLPERGAYTTSVNNRVRDARYGFYLMHMNAPGWQEFQVQDLVTRARKDGFVRGIFLDELVFDPAIGVDAFPIDLATKEDAAKEAQAFVATLRRERPDLALFYNGIGANASPEGASGGMIEGFAVGPWHGKRGGVPWIADLREWEGQLHLTEAATKRGEEVLLLARGPALSDTRARLFAFGSYLLARAPGVRFAYMVDRCLELPLPEWQVDLGEAMADRKIDRVIHGRKFARGEVWVNPEGKKQRVRVKGAKFRLVVSPQPGDEVGEVAWEPIKGGNLVLDAQSAEIVVYARPIGPE